MPKVEKTFYWDYPYFGDYTIGTGTASQTKKVFQKEVWLPKNLAINIELLNNTDLDYQFKFSLDTYLNKTSNNFNDDLLFHCNILQENTGASDVFTADATNQEYIKTLYVDWELLPPGKGKLEENANIILGENNKSTTEKKNTLKERMEFFETFNPINYIQGRNKFNHYFGAKFSDNVILIFSLIIFLLYIFIFI